MEIQKWYNHVQTSLILPPKVLFGCWFQSGWNHNLPGISIAPSGDIMQRRIETPRFQEHFNRGPDSLCGEASSQNSR